uniref:Uncharacterized protein n=1 Tax=Parascaris equorum TaxID=6256 RepID=A0A914RJ85_PAREQ
MGGNEIAGRQAILLQCGNKGDCMGTTDECKSYGTRRIASTGRARPCDDKAAFNILHFTCRKLKSALRRCVYLINSAKIHVDG